MLWALKRTVTDGEENDLNFMLQNFIPSIGSFMKTQTKI